MNLFKQVVVFFFLSDYSIISSSSSSFRFLYLRVCQPENWIFICVQPGPVSWFFMDLCQHDSAALHLWPR